jgi:hypothetical protein
MCWDLSIIYIHSAGISKNLTFLCSYHLSYGHFEIISNGNGSKDVPAMSVMAGIPAKGIAERKSHLSYSYITGHCSNDEL